ASGDIFATTTATPAIIGGGAAGGVSCFGQPAQPASTANASTSEPFVFPFMTRTSRRRDEVIVGRPAAGRHARRAPGVAKRDKVRSGCGDHGDLTCGRRRTSRRGSAR